jgi:hypothetical protein
MIAIRKNELLTPNRHDASAACFPRSEHASLLSRASPAPWIAFLLVLLGGVIIATELNESVPATHSSRSEEAIHESVSRAVSRMERSFMPASMARRFERDQIRSCRGTRVPAPGLDLRDLLAAADPCVDRRVLR